MPIPLLTTFPAPPRIYQPEEEFDAKADEMAGHLPILVTEINAMADAVNTELADIDSSVNAAADSATAAASSASAALTSKNAAAASATTATASKNAAATSATNAADSATAAATSATNAADSATAAANSVNPIGTIIFYAKSTVPTGYLKANGAAVSRTAYAALYAVIGTTFGAGDGSTTFNLPDLRAEFVRGWDDARGIDNGRVFGSAQGELIKTHGHDVSGPNEHRHATQHGGGTIFANFAYNPSVVNGNVGYGDIWNAGDHGLGKNTNQGAETRPRNMALLACIKF